MVRLCACGTLHLFLIPTKHCARGGGRICSIGGKVPQWRGLTATRSPDKGDGLPKDGCKKNYRLVLLFCLRTLKNLVLLLQKISFFARKIWGYYLGGFVLSSRRQGRRCGLHILSYLIRFRGEIGNSRTWGTEFPDGGMVSFFHLVPPPHFEKTFSNPSIDTINMSIYLWNETIFSRR